MSLPDLPKPEDIWRKWDALEARLTAPLTERMLDLAGLRPGVRVLDLATGRGEPAIRAAHRVGPAGVVVGVDLSEPLLQMARERAGREGISNLELRVGDAEVLDGIPVESFDAVNCRWGLMYMASPIAALSNARRALIPGGVLVAALWAEPERVPWYTLPRRLLEAYRPAPAPVLTPVAPAPVPAVFRYSTMETIEHDFREAGLAIDHVEEMQVPVVEAESSGEIIDWTRTFGMAALLRDLPEHDVRAWERAMDAELEKSRTHGVFQLGGVTRIVRARMVIPFPA